MPPKHKDPTRKRERYTLRACNECQRRKVKCSGDDTCINCLNRKVVCDYSSHDDNAGASRPAKRICRSQEREASLSTSPRNSSLQEESRKESKLLKEQVDNLRRDMNVLFCNGEFGNISPSVEVLSGDPPGRLGSSDIPITASPDKDLPIIIAQPQPSSEQRASPRFPKEASPSQGEADTFEPSSPWPNNLAICSQISSLLTPFAGQSAQRPGPRCATDDITFSIHLPFPEKLKLYLRTFSQHFDCYFPCLNWHNLGQRFSESFSAFDYSHSKTTLRVNTKHYKIMGIVCSALAFGIPFATPGDTTEWRPGWKMYLQGKNLMQQFEGCGEADADVFTYHTISAAYLLQGEMLHAASLHIAQGSQIAFKIGLNDQSRWEDKKNDIVSRQNIWWVFYFLDKRITQKSGTPYLVRESESAVRDFREDGKPCIYGTPGFLQTMVMHSHMWTHIWDNFFAPNAPKAGSWEAMQIEDSRVMILHQKTPRQLLWSNEECYQFVVNGESEVQIRRRILVYLRHKCLRLSIRHASLSDTESERERRLSCFPLVQEVLEAVSSYISLYTHHQPCGYALTTSLVECIYHLVPEYRDKLSPLDHYLVRQLLGQARSLLQNLSQSVGSAVRAFKVLRSVLDDDDIVAASLPGLESLMPPETRGLDFKNLFTVIDDPWGVSEEIGKSWPEHTFTLSHTLDSDHGSAITQGSCCPRLSQTGAVYGDQNGLNSSSSNDMFLRFGIK